MGKVVRGDDGVLYLVLDEDGHPGEAGDEQDVGGGIRPGAARRVSIDGVEREVREIVTLAAGGSFSSSMDAPQPFRPPKDRTEALSLGYDLWKYDPLGGAIVALTTFFTFGRGLSIQATGIAEKVLKKFWRKNGLGLKSKVLSDEATAFGEVFVKLVVHKEDVPGPGGKPLWRRGQVEFVPVAPEIVHAVEHNPVNIDDVIAYRLKYRPDAQGQGSDREVVEEEVPPLDKFDVARHDAAMVHLKFNAASNDVFGTSDLVRIREWLGAYQDFLRDGVLINKLYRSPCFDITVRDGDQSDVRRAIRRYENWTIGSNPVHNDSEEWKILEFRGANVSQEDSRRALLLIVAAGSNLPEYMIADGSNSNLASCRAQQLPAIRKFEARQEAFRWFWRRIFEFVLDVADEVGQIAGLDPERDFEGDPIWLVDAKFPPISTETDREIVEANRIAIEDGYLSIQTASARTGLDWEQEMDLKRQEQDQAPSDEQPSEESPDERNPEAAP